MAKLVAAEFLSLDGFMVGEDEDMTWVIDSFTSELGDEIGRQLEETGAILLGRITYEIMSSYWPNAIPEGNYDSDDPAGGSEDPVITAKMNGLPKIVFSRTLKETDWNNSRLIAENIGEEIAKQKAKPGKDLVIQGSASIVKELANQGLIDEFRFIVFPVLLRRGKALFDGITDRANLNLQESRTFPNGVVLLRYQVVR